MLATRENLQKRHDKTIKYCLDLLKKLNIKYNNDLVLEIWWFGSSENNTNNVSSDTDLAVALNEKYYSRKLLRELANIKIDLKELSFDYPEYTNVDLLVKFINSNERLEEYVNKYCTTYISCDVIWKNVINGTRLFVNNKFK